MGPQIIKLREKQHLHISDFSPFSSFPSAQNLSYRILKITTPNQFFIIWGCYFYYLASSKGVCSQNTVIKTCCVTSLPFHQPNCIYFLEGVCTDMCTQFLKHYIILRSEATAESNRTAEKQSKRT